jgi:hypothetical protein
MRIAGLIVVALALSGCVSNERLAARDDAQCAAYGFQPGSDGYAGCRQRLDMARRQMLLNSMPTVTTCGGSGVCTSY